MAPRRRALGSLSARLLELSAKTTPIEPYEVSDNGAVLITQPKGARQDALRAAWSDISRAHTKLQVLVKRVEVIAEPEHPGPDATADEKASYKAAVIEWADYMDSFDTQSAEINAAVDAAMDRYRRALFGDAYDDVMELTGGDSELLSLIENDVNEHFSRGVNPPPDGTDETGAIVDEEEAGKAQSSST